MMPPQLLLVCPLRFSISIVFIVSSFRTVKIFSFMFGSLKRLLYCKFGAALSLLRFRSFIASVHITGKWLLPQSSLGYNCNFESLIDSNVVYLFFVVFFLLLVFYLSRFVLKCLLLLGHWPCYYFLRSLWVPSSNLLFHYLSQCLLWQNEFIHVLLNPSPLSCLSPTAYMILRLSVRKSPLFRHLIRGTPTHLQFQILQQATVD